MNSLVKTLACGSGLLAALVAASLSGCSSSDSNGATGGTSSGGTGGSSKGGSSAAGSSAAGTHNGAAGASDGGTGGSLGAAGADTSAAGADTSAAGDTGAAGAGPEGSAVAKFCNQVIFGGADTTFRLEIGTAPNIVSFSALTGTCVPMTGACKPIPLGADVPYSLIDATDGGDAVLDSGMILVADGKEYVLTVNVDETLVPPAPVLGGGSLTAAAPMCSAFTYADLP